MSENKEFFEKVGTVPKRHSSSGEREDSCAPCETAVREDLTATQMTGARRWAANHDTFWGATQTYDALPPGLYKCGYSNNIGPILVQQKTETDNLLELPDDASGAVITEFTKFWTLREAFKERGFLHKRGFLLWGPPGSGKTSTLHILLKRLIEEHEGVSLFIDNPDLAGSCLHMVRQIEWHRPLIVVLEDIDALVERHGDHQYLALLDGEAQVDNIVFIATTNYPERLDRRFVDRPSRFDTIRYIGMPSAAARRAYLQAKEASLRGAELETWVNLSKGLSIAHLKEMIIANRCLGQPIEEVADRLTEMHDRQPTSEQTPDRDNVVGFIRG